jgi:hypothetical protein
MADESYNHCHVILRQPKVHSLKAQLKLGMQGQQNNRTSRRLMMYIITAGATASALVFIIHAMTTAPFNQQPCNPGVHLRQHPAKVEFAVRDASRQHCLQEVNEALMVSQHLGALRSLVHCYN